MNEEDMKKLTELRAIVFGVNGSPGLVTQIESMKESISELKTYIEEVMEKHLELHKKEDGEMAMVKAEKVKLTGVYVAVILGAIVNIIVAFIGKLP